MTKTGRSKALNGEYSKKLKLQTDFSNVGGLRQHISILREIVIYPLMLSHVYSYFNIKPARGVLFYGPPGTGKTFVAGALAAELNKLGVGKVSFFQRKGADILDKWVGESERKLRELFEKADRARPSLIFFDELDGLAPIRSTKNEQIHCSVVTTLLALLDGLDKMPGVVVIAATNRIDSVDPALRRPGRFDKELFFPLPSTQSRKEIFQVHTQSWKHQLNSESLSLLAEVTNGYSGADIQALCMQAVLCCLKRMYPAVRNPQELHKVKVEPEKLKVEKNDFLSASMCMTPSSLKMNMAMRRLSSSIEPLLKNQLMTILSQLKLFWPHFIDSEHKCYFGQERCAGRILLIGSNMEGLNNHLIPALLHSLEHLPAHVVELPISFNKVMEEASKNLPSILLIPRMDTWWDVMDGSMQHSINSTLKDLYPRLPVLLIVTCSQNPPAPLSDYFYNNNSIVIRVQNPTVAERERFLAPLFFSESICSVSYVHKTRTFFANMDSLNKGSTLNQKKENISDSSKNCNLTSAKQNKGDRCTLKRQSFTQSNNEPLPKFKKLHESQAKDSGCLLESTLKTDSRSLMGYGRHYSPSLNDNHDLQTRKHVSAILTDVIPTCSFTNITGASSTRSYRTKIIKAEPIDTDDNNKKSVPSYGDSQDTDKRTIYNLWNKAARVTSEGFAVGQLELLYDVTASCINIYKHDFNELISNLDKLLSDFEKPST